MKLVIPKAAKDSIAGLSLTLVIPSEARNLLFL